MSSLVPGFIKWRYKLYLEEHFDLYDTMSSYFGVKYNNFKVIKSAKVAYIYANQRNVGDFISHLGIKAYLNEPGPTLFFSPIWLKKLKHYLYFLKKHNPDCLLIIGGGGLFQGVFEEPFKVVLDSGLRFAIFGVGINSMADRSQLKESTFNRVVSQAEFISVRDTYSENAVFNVSNRRIYKCICPSVYYLNSISSSLNRKNNQVGKVLTHVIHPADLRLANIDEMLLRNEVSKFASSSGYQLEEITNMSSNHLVPITKIWNSDLVVTSRLHGAIMSYTFGVPFVPIGTDIKMENFLTTYTDFHCIKLSNLNLPDFFRQIQATDLVENKAIVKPSQFSNLLLQLKILQSLII